MQAELVVDCGNIHGEGILWNPADRRVWWTDIHGQAMWWHDPATGQSGSHALPARLCAFAPRAKGGWIMAFANRVELWSAAMERETVLHEFEPENPHTRLNDGRTDRQGRFIVGGMNEGTGSADSSVIRIDAGSGVEQLIEGVACANSICFSPEGTEMFFTDTTEKTIRLYAYGDSGLGPARVHADMAAEPGLPDGSCVDAEGGVWNAEWEGGQVVRISPAGRITQRIALPVPKATCCAFGGADLSTLFITTSRLMSSPEEVANAPLSGALFASRPGFKGVADAPFAG
ncbi:SMP-30/gluconolactonase/LRE family protein [Mesorhizobium sp. DCY119]|uniref:SMP-30/gluconolactonase/LRE family protein n=1 Tax=Mesorhizobium sp. DCY119 TaxID=2108445 RepID=UPI000E6BA207|nr:SMP-30/gluconolactonase/LRE family protein [Mesorhizobium sp. DCY119]RJG46177.1 SMP-30/gluconolactonase/LRE family protein [Mesorhizobium sp. DCY119]